MKTKWGNALINERGYYQITTRKDGFKGEFLHRLIYQAYFPNEDISKYVIHHKDGDKLNNNINNLVKMEKGLHTTLHHPDELKIEDKVKISKSTNTTGYFRVYKKAKKDCIQGFTYVYSYYDEGKRREFSSIDIDKLREKVEANNQLWMELN